MEMLPEDPYNPPQRDKDAGVTVVEYAIMLALIAIIVAAFGQGLSGSVTSVFSRMLSILARGS